jgi:hypothetical protein
MATLVFRLVKTGYYSGNAPRVPEIDGLKVNFRHSVLKYLYVIAKKLEKLPS